ncbi:MAG: hypothetical protein RLZZ423_711, partial [Cyanobacteriota bacterium]
MTEAMRDSGGPGQGGGGGSPAAETPQPCPDMLQRILRARVYDV